MSPGPGGPLSVAGFRVAARRAAILVAIVIAVGILRLRAQEIGYVAALAAGAVALVVAGRSPRPGARRLADLRWWGVYVLGFMSFALIRTFADDTGIPWQYGYVIDIEGGLVDGSMVLEGHITDYGEKISHDFRGTWTPNADGTVRQFFEQFSATDETWKPWFDGLYTPLKKPADSQ